MHSSEEIGSRLREERMRCGLTQDQAAQAAGVAKRTQANYEAGSSDAPALYLSTVLSELGFDIMYILSGVRTTLGSGDLSEVEDEMIHQYRIIPEYDQHAIRRFLKAMADDVKAPTG
ncbi:helix-turn-helix domain-containing protein [Pseudomonas triticifolii]|uniref:Helix-turn-helix transcriptional regulator n=1 Tax=Pseudomonas triticifolii TaxID=2762592 RepID=A0ABR7BKH5_9PSED|nr:helix-turn-helix transcriptional regulator [Pseudomonas triticifolii]MBC3957699.1 helix-turn-helix transcriptional regulator [Pseudomonas triticifolii]